NVIKGEDQFSAFENRDISASLRYGSLNNAVLVSKNAANTSATLAIPSIGFTKTFTGSDSKDLEKQIQEFARKNGARVYGDFIRSLNATTDLGVTDGNPL